MHTVEAAYLIPLSLLIMLTLISATLRIENQLKQEIDRQIQTELKSHRFGGEKQDYLPEKFVRQISLAEDLRKELAPENSSPEGTEALP